MDEKALEAKFRFIEARLDIALDKIDSQLGQIIAEQEIQGIQIANLVSDVIEMQDRLKKLEKDSHGHD